ncbi:nicolin-1 isoform X1 [Takifugu flavidus]|uniref:Nicolin-1 NPCEDRG n=1 Tax=Takifugu flavidus TaxID=433684 RepID=A0A5C6N3K6_9TELE|nr:nicolin-1 isoform X1 [Takifugu flavidus]TWW61388.1 Nicolin-1 NPCEDRG [Takifugu flavidus]
MDDQAVSCTIKPAVFLNIGGAEAAARSGVCVLDVSLPVGKTVNIEKITFTNFYTASVTLRLLRRGPGQEAAARWCTALKELRLMHDPHTEGGSQDSCCIHRTQMQVPPDHVSSVRLILRQPSCVWLNFTLEDIKIYPHSSAGNPDPDKDLSDWLSDLTVVDQHLDLQDLPDPHAVSSSIQQMWALTEVMQTQQTNASIGRFDVDGCYHLDLLSLT